MYPNQQYAQGGGGRGVPYPQQSPYGGGGQGFAGGYQPNIPTPYGGNPYSQGGYSYGQNQGYGPSSGQQSYGANPYAQSGGYGPSSSSFMSNNQHSQRLNQVAQKYEIHPQFIARLHALGNYEVVLLCDDSSSMNTPIQGSNQTRWDELKSIVNIVVDISAVIDPNGVDVYFLNRDPMLNITDGRYIRQAFNMPPRGMTPLVPALRRILAAKQHQTYGKKLLILIATDGAPTNDRGQVDIGSLEAVLRHELTSQTHVTFLACTDDLQAVNYLSQWDKRIPNVDVTDDYRSECVEVHRTRGRNFPFSFGDYIVKSLLGAVDPWFDSLDDLA